MASQQRYLILLYVILSVSSHVFIKAISPDAPLLSKVTTRARQLFNFSNLFGSATMKPAYDRLASQPVFAVTTSWGSPYLLYERRDESESSLEFDDDTGSEEFNSVRGSGVSRTDDEVLFMVSGANTPSFHS